MDIINILGEIGRDPNCVVRSPAGIPEVTGPNRLPADLALFYERCGGVDLYLNRDFGFRVVSPSEFVLANPVILGEYYKDNKQEIDNDASAYWFVVCRGSGPEECIVIDLNPDRLGRCYDAFHDVYATADSKVVARSFSDLLTRIFRTRGNVLHWEESSFEGLGCAYD